jgi:hypothetical protein
MEVMTMLARGMRRLPHGLVAQVREFAAESPQTVRALWKD